MAEDAHALLTEAEQARTAAVLASVSTRTLLKCLATFHAGNQDAELILATLIDRLPFDEVPHSD